MPVPVRESYARVGQGHVTTERSSWRACVAGKTALSYVCRPGVRPTCHSRRGAGKVIEARARRARRLVALRTRPGAFLLSCSRLRLGSAAREAKASSRRVVAGGTPIPQLGLRRSLARRRAGSSDWRRRSDACTSSSLRRRRERGVTAASPRRERGGRELCTRRGLSEWTVRTGRHVLRAVRRPSRLSRRRALPSARGASR